MARPRPALFFDPRFGDHHPRHATRGAHPDNHARFEALAAASEAAGPAFARPEIPAFDRQLAARVHAPAYLDKLETLGACESHSFDADTSISSGSLSATQTATSALCHAVDLAISGQHLRSFCLARPPGHHARPQQAMGFCLLNHVSIAAAHARARGLKRVAIVDWDVHPGNGSAEIFESDPGVFVIDLHQLDHWPGSGALAEVGVGAGAGRTLNLPLPVRSGDLEFERAFDRVVEPALAAFEPELILVSAGFDAHRDDPLSDLQVTAPGFAKVCARVRAYADRWASSRLILNLEGGYAPAALQESVNGCLHVLSRPQPVISRPPATAVATPAEELFNRARELFGLRE